MRKLDKYELLFAIYFGLTIIRYCLVYSNLLGSEFNKSFTFIIEHSAMMWIAIFLYPYVDTLFTRLLIIGFVIFKAELVLYNIALLIVGKANYNSLNCSYDVVMALTLTIGVIVLGCRFFDKIVIFITKIIHAFKVLSKWRKQ